MARALAADPPVLLMDEPFSAVDPVVRGDLQQELLRLQAQLHKTIVFVTHDIDEAVKVGDHIAVMQVTGGKLVQFDTPERVLAHPANEFVESFLGFDRGIKLAVVLSGRYPRLRCPATVQATRSPADVKAAAAAAGTDGSWLSTGTETGRLDRCRRPWTGRASSHYMAVVAADRVTPSCRRPILSGRLSTPWCFRRPVWLLPSTTTGP